MFIIQMCLEKGQKFWKNQGNIREFCEKQNVETMLSKQLDYRNSMPASSYQQQKLRVCEVCSAYLGIHDNDRRLADHFGGKLHLGFIEIRDKLEDLTVSRPKSHKEVFVVQTLICTD